MTSCYYVSTVPLPWCSVHVILICEKSGLKICTTVALLLTLTLHSPLPHWPGKHSSHQDDFVSWQTAVNTTRQGSFPNIIVTYWTPTETFYNSRGDILARCAVNFCLAQAFAICVKPVAMQGWFPCYQRSCTPLLKGALLWLYHHWHLFRACIHLFKFFASPPEFEKRQSLIQHSFKSGKLQYTSYTLKWPH